LPKLVKGYNITTLAYGITGSGKTYTMLGNGFESCSEQDDSKKIKGITFLTLNELFSLLEEEKAKTEQNKLYKYDYSIKISYLEVYNEKVRDLLRNDEISNLTILEDPELGVVIPGLKT
jgi:hypothetical protein